MGAGVSFSRGAEARVTVQKSQCSRDVECFNQIPCPFGLQLCLKGKCKCLGGRPPANI
jgi:hypothetical protein